MAIYEYLCAEHRAHEVTLPLGTAPPSIACPACGGKARRVFSKPMLMSGRRELVAAIDHAEKTRHEPDVVTSLPPRNPRRRMPVLPLTPTLRRLPRP